MASKLTLKRSAVADKVPVTGDLDYGELAINYQDGKLFYKTADNAIISLIDGRTSTIASAATITPVANASDTYEVTALAVNATIAAPTGTLVANQKLLLKIKDNGTARTLNWNAIYRVVGGVILPTTTVAGKVLYVGCIYNATDSVWDVLAVGQS